MRSVALALILVATPVIAAPSAGWLDAASQGIRDGEYHLSPKDGAGGWTAPNREHDLRAWWHEGALEVTPRVDAGAWSFTYRLDSVGRASGAPVSGIVRERVSEGRIEWQRDGITEWYLNDARGIEQGFTLETRPPGDVGDPVILESRVSGLLAVPSEDGSSVLLRTPAGSDAMRVRDLVVTDASGATLEACLSVTTGALLISFDDRDAAYPVTVDPLLSSPVWTAESDQSGASFGFSVATAGDVNGDGYSDVVVGAWQYDAGQTDEGRAFAYLGSASGLAATPFWSVDSDQVDSRFGRSVATAGDVNGDGYSDVIIGAPAFDDVQSGEGRAFVYHGSATGLALAPAWIGENDQAGSALGSSVAAAGDVNGDGFGDVIVGVPFFDGAIANEGGANVYLGSSAGLASTPPWTATSGQASSLFGESVSTAGDVNGDGLADVIVGATVFANGEAGEGRAFVYHGTPTGPSAVPAWTAESDQANAHLGERVSTAGDVNGDGYADVIVAAPSFDAGQSDEGRVLAYLGSATGLASTPAWTAESNQSSALFGLGIGAAGDVDDDGYGDIVIGAYLYDAGETDEGRVFLYRGSASGLPAASSWTAESNQASAWFGISVASAGDVNGDGWSDIIVGAHGWDGGQADEGRAYVFNGSPSGLATTAAWMVDGDQAGASFGYAVSSAGDVNGDGYSDAIVSAPFYDAGQSSEGAVFLYLGSSFGLSPTSAWIGEGNQSGAILGESIACAGDVNGDGYSDVIAGAYSYDNGETGEGAAFVFMGSPSGLSPLPAWTVEGNQRSAAFGYRVAGVGDVNGDGYADVAVGALGFDGGQADEGSVLLYLGSMAGLLLAPAWTVEGEQAGAALCRVATAGDVDADGYSDVIVGADSYDGGQTDEGRAWLYLGSATGLSTAPAWFAEGNQADAYFGFSIASAGDVNGDTFSDVIVGAVSHDNGEMDEGRVQAYLGRPGGLQPLASWQVESNQAEAHLGLLLASAGDVNGDGYSDVALGAGFYDGGETDEGAAFLYLGSPTGLPALPAWSAASDQAGSRFGFAIAPAGDCNGDGYSDLIVGADFFDNGLTDQGRAFVYYGNGSDGLDRIARQRRADDSAPIDILGATIEADGFRISANGRSPYGRDRVRLEIEVKPLGAPFDGVGIETTPFTDTGAPGASGSVVPLSLVHAPLSPGPHHWRARLRGTFPHPWQSHWMSPPYNCVTETDLRVAGSCDPAACDDGDACNGVETCDPSSGGCVPGTPVICDDGDACNGVETCDPSTGGCVPGTPVACDDGDACNGVETCDPATGGCAPGTPVTCDDGDACNGVETCDPSTGGCLPGPRADADGDGSDDCDDCAPLDGGAFALPREADVRVTRGPLIAWGDLATSAGSGTSYDVASDLLAALHAARSASGPCVVTGVVGLAWLDSRVSGDTYYLVRGVNACGPAAGEGWGADSLGAPRPACP